MAALGLGYDTWALSLWPVSSVVWVHWHSCPQWDLSAQTRTGTHVSCFGSIGRWILNHWTTREVPVLPIFKLVCLFMLSFQCVLVTQLCLTLCDPMDYNLPGSSVHGNLQTRLLEWVTTVSPSPGDLPWPRDQTWVSCIAQRFFAIWTIREASSFYILAMSLLSDMWL